MNSDPIALITGTDVTGFRNPTPAVPDAPARRFRSFVMAALAVVAAACGSSTTTVTAPSTISRCAVTLRASNPALPASGGSGEIAVTTARECAWSAVSEAAWLAVVGPSSGQGDGTVVYRAAENADPVVRRAAIVLNDQRAEISQAAGTCLVRLGDASAEFPQSGGSGSVQVEASSPMCSWTASTESEWIRLGSPSSGQGSGTVRFTVAPTNGPPRAGTIRVADQQFSVTQSQGCTYTIAPSNGSVPATGGTGSVSVTTAAGCPWIAVSNASWLTITEGASGTGPGTVAFSAAPTDGPGRIGTLVIAGERFTVGQGGACAYQVEPLSHSVAAAGGTLTVTVTTPGGCDWSASSAVPWLTISGPSAGSGNGTVLIAVAASSGGARSGTLTVAGQTVTVNQAQACSYAIQPESQAIPAEGGTGTVNVTAGPGCGWTAASNADWIKVTSGATGAGNGSVGFSVDPTTGPARSGTLAIAGRTFTVNQGQGCAATLSPEAAAIGAAGGPLAFDVRTGGQCTWTAASGAPWIRVDAGATGTGNGTVRLQIEANGGARRTGTVTAAGRTFTVEQESGCSVALGAPGQIVPAGGGEGSVAVSAPPGCSWNAVTGEPWITITAGASGSGNGSVAFVVQANPGPERAGTITIAGQAFTITQAGACTFGIAPQDYTAPASGGRVDVAVAAPEGCGWTAVSNVPWLGIEEGASGSGGGTVRLRVQSNAGAPRQGTATIAGLIFTVNQASGCTYALSPRSRSADEEGETNDFTVKTSASDCAWTAVSTVSWITILGDGRGTGTGRVEYSVQRNTSGERRTGTIRVEDQVFTVTQDEDEN